MIEISSEALLYLLYRLEIPTLPGMPPELLDALTEDTKNTVLAAGEHALRARKLVKIERKHLIVDKTLAGLLALCIELPNGFVIKRFSKNTSCSTILTYSDELLVEHQINNGVHQFSVHEEPRLLSTKLAESIIGDKSSEETTLEETGLNCQLPLKEFLEIQLLIKEKQNDEALGQMIRILQDNAVDEISAHHLANILHNSDTFLSIGGWFVGSNNEVDSTNFGLFKSELLWLIIS